MGPSRPHAAAQDRNHPTRMESREPENPVSGEEESMNKSAVPQSKAVRRKAMSDRSYSYLLITPAMVVILFFALIPLVYAINVAFHAVDPKMGSYIGQAVGLKNFRDMLNNEQFWDAIGRTLRIAVLAVGVEMMLGTALAFLINQLRWFRGPIRSFFLLPLAAAPAAVSMIWRYMYDNEFGVFNGIATILNLPTVNWLGGAMTAPLSIILFDIWQWTPFVMLIVLAGLQSLPREPFEAAELDGASVWMTLRRLTLPMLAPVLSLVFVLRAIDTIRLYDPVATMTLGGPGTATETVSYYIYRVGLKYFRLDQASAMSLLMLFAIVVFTGLALRPLMRYQAERAKRG